MNEDLNIDADVEFFVKDTIDVMKKSKEFLEKELKLVLKKTKK